MMLCLQGLKALVHFDPQGFLFFEASRRGFWRSFLAALLCLPIWCLSLYQPAAALDDTKLAHYLLAQMIAYVIAWLAYPLLVVRVADIFGVWQYYYRYMVAYNWFRAVLQLIWLPLLVFDLLPGSLTPGMTMSFWLMAQIAEMAYDWFLARHGLKLETGTAVALVLIDVLLGLVIDQIIGLL